jgi:hypothetical protein
MTWKFSIQKENRMKKRVNEIASNTKKSDKKKKKKKKIETNEEMKIGKE